MTRTVATIFAVCCHLSVLVVLTIFAVVGAAAQGGEIALTPSEHATVVNLIATDREAYGQFKFILKTARGAAADQPNPIAWIQTEGKLRGDPVKTQTAESLMDMPKMLALAWAGSFDPSADEAATFNAMVKQFLIAWAGVNRSHGDPIDDTNLDAALTAYDLTRAAYTADERVTVEAWFRQVAAAEEQTGRWDAHPKWNNWTSHRLKIVGLIAFELGDEEMLARVLAAYKDQIEHNLNADGTTYDFLYRDALHYHVYDLEPLLSLDTLDDNFCCI